MPHRFHIYARLDNKRVRFIIHALSANEARNNARLHPNYRGCIIIGAIAME
jgi:hypothetical protein